MNNPTHPSQVVDELPVGQLLFSFNGRIGRHTYWDATLFFAFVGLMLLVMHPLLYAFYCLLTVWPSLAVTVKPFHDRDKSGWWVFISMIPLLGWIWTFVELGLLRGTNGPNRYGPD